MTIKFLKKWGFAFDERTRRTCQYLLDGGAKIVRIAQTVLIENEQHRRYSVMFPLNTPGTAVTFAAELNKLRRPLHLVKADLDEDWARRVKQRDTHTCVICGIQGPLIKAALGDDDEGLFSSNPPRKKQDVLTAHHWLKTKSHAGMARWSTACGATVHYADHIHRLHENPCWIDLDKIYKHVLALEGEEAITAAINASIVSPTEKAVRALWWERVGRETSE